VIHIERATQLPAPPEQVFKAFHTQAGRLALGRGYVDAVEVEGEGLGSIVRIYTGGHLQRCCVVERIELFDPVNFRLNVLMIDTGGKVPVADYRAKVRLVRAGAEGTVVMVRTRFVPVDMDDEAALALISQNYDLLMRNLHTLFPAEQNSERVLP
jgi:hypothetical protein